MRADVQVTLLEMDNIYIFFFKHQRDVHLHPEKESFICLTYLHKLVTVGCVGVRGHVLEEGHEFGEVGTAEYLSAVPCHQGKRHSDENGAALVKHAIPDPQQRLRDQSLFHSNRTN